MNSRNASSVARIDRRRLVFGERLLPAALARGRVEAPFRLPLLDPVVVGERGAVEGGLEIRLGVGAAEEMRARRDLAEGLEAPGRFATGRRPRARTCMAPADRHRARTSRSDAIGRLRSSLRHAARNWCPPRQRRQQRVGALIGCLRIGDLRGAQRAAGAERHVDAPRQLPPCRRARGSARACRRSARPTASRSTRRSCRRSPARRDCTSCMKAMPATPRPGSGAGAGDRHRAMAPERMKGVSAGLVVAGIDLERPEHGRVPGHRRIGVDEAGQHVFGRPVPDRYSPCRTGSSPFDRILARSGWVTEPMNGLSLSAYGIDHLEMALVDRQVDRLAHRAARMMQMRATCSSASRNCGNPRSCRSGGPGRDRARTASRNSARRRVDLPPDETLRSGLRACWTYSHGALVAERAA